jgi:hypothetical protein
MMVGEGLTSKDYEVMFDLIHKARSEQLFALTQYMAHELNVRNELALEGVRNLFNAEHKDNIV